MNMSTEQMQWMVKVFQPERTVASLPGAASINDAARAALLGLDPDFYSAELARLAAGAKKAAQELLADPQVAAMVDRLPLQAGARVFAVGDSRTSDPQSWAVILQEMLATRRPSDHIAVLTSAISGDTTTHALIRIGEVLAGAPDWILFFVGLNDARTQGSEPTKTIVHHEETARNFAELRSRLAKESKARRIWLTPVAVNEGRLPNHWALARFGVRFLNADIAKVAAAMRQLGDPVIDLFQQVDTSSLDALLMDDGLHFTEVGQQRMALEVLRAWSDLT
jgi:lysophospholipase L1-like esterase